MASCYFCTQNVEPSYKEYEALKKFLSYRGKIVSSEKSRVCALHQRKLARAIKQARQMALLPYVVYEE
ncbi:30S ribosomal protein S18 [Candidatus Roizmanbacteria bacterium CG10_big_fil_rev_8_21_14_0_10_45_7]|uniref:30S ribosomal protein S18 n=1 Tax=Candidatus Roizmanbacteria bacterium CG10_big_fil_rev_8_21_14_0_10_45_7 TaxID=1974854 RepID=A0A2M8KU40_9BACT|nr:MAG: 30S ribosomal protein S18 [Candidatus Roizmanbacteria bacterium CG10_big_fil_rev_8_21_14_0_10_45_7]